MELTGEDSIPLLANYLGISKQAVYDWIKKERIPIKSVKSKVENINPYFLKGESDRIYVDSAPESAKESSVIADQLLREERSRLGIEDIPDTELGHALQGALDDAVSLVLKLRRLIEMDRKSDS